MLFKKQYIALFVLLALMMSACEYDGQFLTQVPEGAVPPQLDLDSGPKAWIEFPPEGEILPMETVTIIVYAASTDGVGGINMSINGVPLPAGQLKPLTTDGSSRLVRTDLLWNPSAEGKYEVEARAVGASGDSGLPSHDWFCIVTCKPETAQDPVTETPLPFITLPPVNPPSTAFLPLTTEAPPIDPPVVTVEPAIIEPHIDETQPEISEPWLEWNSEECRAYGVAYIYDPNGISWVNFEYNLNGQGWKSVWMSDEGGNVWHTWRSEAGVLVGEGIGTIIGTIEYRVRAINSQGNESLSLPGSHIYYSCDG